MASTMRGRHDRSIKLFKISHMKSLLMLSLISATLYLIFKPVHPTLPHAYKIKNIHMMAVR